MRRTLANFPHFIKLSCIGRMDFVIQDSFFDEVVESFAWLVNLWPMYHVPSVPKETGGISAKLASLSKHDSEED